VGGGGLDGSLLDTTGAPQNGCNAVDILFVLDNSGSMCFHQKSLAQAFPKFADAIFDHLPAGTSVHVGITGSSFCESGSHSNSNCKAGETQAEFAAHFIPPTQQQLPENGWQGRLFEYQGKHFFEANTGDATTASR